MGIVCTSILSLSLLLSLHDQTLLETTTITFPMGKKKGGLDNKKKKQFVMEAITDLFCLTIVQCGGYLSSASAGTRNQKLNLSAVETENFVRFLKNIDPMLTKTNSVPK